MHTETLWSGRKLAFASSIGAWLPAVTVVVLGAWRTTGVPFFLAIAVASWFALVLDALVAFVTLRRARVALQWPATVTVSEPFPVVLTDAAPQGALLEVVSSVTGPQMVRVGSGTRLAVRFDQRAVHTSCYGFIENLGPLGLIGCQRRFTMPITTAVGPKVADRAIVPDMAGEDIAVDAPATAQGTDLTRSVRPYRRGDQQTAVAWKATARSGELMVRELEGVVETELVMVMALRARTKTASVRVLGDKSKAMLAEVDDLNEQAVARAASYATAALRSGKQVRIISNQEVRSETASRPPRRFGKLRLFHVVGESAPANDVVRSESHLAFLLAAATPGANLTADLDQPALVVSATGDRWLRQPGSPA